MTKNDHKISIPGYRIIRKIGEGGMSVVYLAHQESLKRDVALKVMRPIITDEENVVRRFEQEAEIIAKLYHPNIVNIYEVGHIDDDVLFYSMPYLQHGDLTTFAYQNDAELKQMLAGICDGLSYAHTQGVVHRDIKPENILFDQFGNVQIADFGIALSTGRRRFTKDSRIVGSVYYMSPEQAQSKHVDARSDIYGLGAILYEILTGEPVFEEDSDLSLMMAHVSNPVPDLPAELAHWQPVIDRCLAKSPNQRYQNMAALKQAVMAVKSEADRFWTPAKAGLLSVAAGVMLLLAWQWFVNLSEDGPEMAQLPAQKPPAIPTVKADEAVVKAMTEVLDEQPLPMPTNLLSETDVQQLLEQAQNNIEKRQLTTPTSDNALDQILRLLSNIPDHAEGLKLLSNVMAGYYDLIYQAVLKGDLSQAKQLATSVAEVRHRTILVNEQLLYKLEAHTDIERSLLLGTLVEKVNKAKQRLAHDQVDQLIQLVDQVVPGNALIEELMEATQDMLKGGQVLTDKLGVKSVVVTPEFGGVSGLIPYGLAVTQSEITYAQFDRFMQAKQHELKRCKSQMGSNLIFSQRNYTKPGFRVSSQQPVVCVTWQAANQYAQWLSQQTGLNYRLPTAKEWRHIKKLGDREYRCGEVNLAGQELPSKDEDKRLLSCDDGVAYVADYATFKHDKLGLYGMHGNVKEWLSGCQKLGKFKAIFSPDDLCDSNPSIGRSWLSGEGDAGSSQQIDFDEAWTHIGFRLVRDLRKES